MKMISVFCGSSSGFSNIYLQHATELGKTLAVQGIGLVYGGARIGLMGAVADGVLSEGGKVTGVMPYFLQAKEIAHSGLTELILVDSMHERKTVMNDLCDGVIALAGGYGTLDEFFEMMTWSQLGLHKKPLALFNVEGYYEPLISMVDTMVEKGFLNNKNREMLLVGNTTEEVLDKMRDYVAPKIDKWVDRKTI